MGPRVGVRRRTGGREALRTNQNSVPPGVDVHTPGGLYILVQDRCLDCLSTGNFGGPGSSGVLTRSGGSPHVYPLLRHEIFLLPGPSLANPSLQVPGLGLHARSSTRTPGLPLPGNQGGEGDTLLHFDLLQVSFRDSRRHGFSP